MARITHVKKAQQRYATVPVLDESGQQVQTPVMDSRTGQQKVSKRGPVFRSVTKEDRSKPLPPYQCGACHKPIEVGTPYKWIKPKSGPYGGTLLTRHESCPTWNVWDYSSSLSARVAQITHNFWQEFDSSTLESTDDVESILQNTAQEIRDLASEKEEAADNMEEGFGHETSASAEIREVQEGLESWADEVEAVTLPDYPEPEEEDCDNCDGLGHIMETCSECDGSGEVEVEDPEEGEDTTDTCGTCSGSGEEEEDCTECGGTGKKEAGDPTEDQMEEWLEEVRDACSIVDECPV